MKAQFKYAFITGLSVRGVTFGLTAGMMLVFIILGTLKQLPMPALITAVSLGGVGIAAVFTVNIINDVAIIRRMYAAPGAYLYALVPTHRGKMLLASVITMMVLDVVTMTVVITGETVLSLMLAGESVMQIVADAVGTYATASNVMTIVWATLLILAGYLFIVMVITFTETVKRSLFYQKPAAGLLAFLTACACFYVFSWLQLVMIPFGTVVRYGLLFQIMISGSGTVAMSVYALLLLLSAAGMFVLTSRLLERKINI